MFTDHNTGWVLPRKVKEGKLGPTGFKTQSSPWVNLVFDAISDHPMWVRAYQAMIRIYSMRIQTGNRNSAYWYQLKINVQ
jgi:hypothetical protein